MALFRALETTRSADSRLCEDRHATAFLRPRLRLVVGLSRLRLVGALIRAYIDHRWPGARTSAVARTRFIDDFVEAALSSGIEQVVILGAGFDARAYRLAAMTRAAVFEVDHPATSAAKRAMVDTALASPARHVRFVPIDFNAQPLPSAMKAAGYAPERRTLFIWEGVTNYLTADAVDATLRWCAQAAAGSKVVFTYVHQRVLDTPEAFHGTQKLFATLHAANEHWTFGLDPSRVPAFLAERGLRLDEDAGTSEYRERYYGRSAMRMQGYEFYRIAVAEVPDHPLNTLDAPQQPPTAAGATRREKNWDLILEPDPTPDQTAFLEDRLYEFNVAATGISDGRPLAIFVRADDGQIVAGLGGHTWGGCCEIRQVWVHERVRRQGLGTALLQAAEAEARRRGCRQILLATHSFQAPDFYRRLGFELIATAQDYPQGHQHLLLRKGLRAESEPDPRTPCTS
jgi:methyltransferase (TIGR00027 family)